LSTPISKIPSKIIRMGPTVSHSSINLYQTMPPNHQTPHQGHNQHWSHTWNDLCSSWKVFTQNTSSRLSIKSLRSQNSSKSSFLLQLDLQTQQTLLPIPTSLLKSNGFMLLQVSDWPLRVTGCTSSSLKRRKSLLLTQSSTLKQLKTCKNQWDFLTVIWLLTRCQNNTTLNQSNKVTLFQIYKPKLQSLTKSHSLEF
jgi:hypothetical protein